MFYNQKRKHLRLGNISPVQYEHKLQKNCLKQSPILVAPYNKFCRTAQ
ncbi:IS3 family transposase [Moellerella wisconsensis]